MPRVKGLIYKKQYVQCLGGRAIMILSRQYCMRNPFFWVGRHVRLISNHAVAISRVISFWNPVLREVISTRRAYTMISFCADKNLPEYNIDRTIWYFCTSLLCRVLYQLRSVPSIKLKFKARCPMPWKRAIDRYLTITMPENSWDSPFNILDQFDFL